MANPTVSVIIPAFNAEATLVEAVSSVLAQTFGDLECLVIDDGSADGTLAVATKIAAGDSRVRVLRHPGGVNKGVAASRNLGIEESRGQFLAFLDADDAWLPVKLERQLAIMEEFADVGFVFGDVYLSREPDPEIPMTSQPLSQDTFRASMSEMFNESSTAAAKLLNFHGEPYRFIPSPTPLVRRALFRDGLEFVGRPMLSLQYEDYLMWLVLSMRTRFYCIQEPLAIYRMHAGSFTGRFRASRSVVDHLTGLEEVQRMFLESLEEPLCEGWLDSMREHQKERVISCVHRAPWTDMWRLLRLARKYRVTGEVLRRRISASSTGFRENVLQLRNRARIRGKRFS